MKGRKHRSTLIGQLREGGRPLLFPFAIYLGKRSPGGILKGGEENRLNKGV